MIILHVKVLCWVGVRGRRRKDWLQNKYKTRCDMQSELAKENKEQLRVPGMEGKACFAIPTIRVAQVVSYKWGKMFVYEPCSRLDNMKQLHRGSLKTGIVDIKNCWQKELVTLKDWWHKGMVLNTVLGLLDELEPYGKVCLSNPVEQRQWNIESPKWRWKKPAKHFCLHILNSGIYSGFLQVLQIILSTTKVWS